MHDREPRSSSIGDDVDDVTLEEFETLVMFSSTEHLGLTAEAMGCSVAKVQRVLRRLENNLALALLEREGRRLRLTRAGWALAEEGGRVLRARTDAVAAARAVAGERRGRLRVGHTFSLGISFVPGVVADYLGWRDLDAVSLRHGAATEMVTALLGGHIDAAFTSSAPVETDIVVVPLFEEGTVLAVPDGFERGDDRVRLVDLRDRPFVSMPSGANSRSLMVRACARAGFSPRVVLEADDLFTVAGAVAAGVGIAVLPSRMADFRLRGLRYLEVVEETPTVRTISLAFRKAAAHRDALERLRRVAVRHGEAISRRSLH